MMCSSLWLLLMLHDTPSSNALAIRERNASTAVQCERRDPRSESRQPPAALQDSHPDRALRPGTPGPGGTTHDALPAAAPGAHV
jgi:hypothetical protein